MDNKATTTTMAMAVKECIGAHRWPLFTLIFNEFVQCISMKNANVNNLKIISIKIDNNSKYYKSLYIFICGSRSAKKKTNIAFSITVILNGFYTIWITELHIENGRIDVAVGKCPTTKYKTEINRGSKGLEVEKERERTSPTNNVRISGLQHDDDRRYARCD